VIVGGNLGKNEYPRNITRLEDRVPVMTCRASPKKSPPARHSEGGLGQRKS